MVYSINVVFSIIVLRILKIELFTYMFKSSYFLVNQSQYYILLAFNKLQKKPRKQKYISQKLG